MRIEELKKRNKIIAKYGANLNIQYENYHVGSLVLSLLFLFSAGIIILLGAAEKNYWYWGVGLSLCFSGVTFIFITGLFKLLGQIKEINKIILLKLEGDNQKEVDQQDKT